MMTIMRMRSAILTIAYYISAILKSLVITFSFGKICAASEVSLYISQGGLLEKRFNSGIVGVRGCNSSSLWGKLLIN